VLLRRKSGRVIDTVWMARNADYAVEVLRIARTQPDADIVRLADRFEALMFGVERPADNAHAFSGDTPAASTKYIGALR
jgi:hypothetical protein